MTERKVRAFFDTFCSFNSAIAGIHAALSTGGLRERESANYDDTSNGLKVLCLAGLVDNMGLHVTTERSWNTMMSSTVGIIFFVWPSTGGMPNCIEFLFLTDTGR